MAASLAGKTALVTGASRGIGRAIAIRLAQEGALTVVHYGRNKAAAEATVQQIEGAGGRAIPLQADLASLGEIDRLFQNLDLALASRTGEAHLDILVNNAGIGIAGTLQQTSAEVFDSLFDVNVKGLFFVTQKAAPRLREGGRVVNISSQVALRAYPDCIAYAATKGAVNTFTRSLAAELGPQGITVNTVAPGMTETDFVTAYLENEEYVRTVKASTALGRVGQPSDIAGAVLSLVSPDAGWVTGQVIYATGGMQL